MNPEPIPNPDNGTVDIRYNLTSKANDQVELSAGWGPTGLLGRVSLKFNNFSVKNLFHPGTYRGIIPQGEGQTFTISGQTSGKYFQSYSISFLDPWFGGKRPNTFSASAYYSKITDFNNRFLNDRLSRFNPYMGGYYGGRSGYYGNGGSGFYESAYDPDKYMQMIGINLGFGKRLSWPDDYFYTMLTLNYQLYSLKNWDRYFLIKDGVCHKISVDLSLQRSSVDNPLYTR